MSDPLRKIWVGLDLVEGNVGPLNFAAWLAGLVSEGAQVTGAHVVEPWSGFGLVPADLDVDWQGLAQARAEAAMSSAGLEGEAHSVQIALDEAPELFLSDAIEQSKADLLVIGRLARRGQDRLVRLGSVARRLLRALPGPLAVVPPDLPAGGVGAGPIVVAIDGKEDSLPAYRWAHGLAHRAQRELLLVHVVPMPEGWGIGVANKEVLAKVVRELEIEGRRKLEAWTRAHGVFGHEAVIAHGNVVSELHEIATDRDAACIVLGSRRLGALGRWFSGSTGTDLAAASVAPVVVVPPEDKE